VVIPMESCSHERIVRLDVRHIPDNPGFTEDQVYWICTQCNSQFVEKSAVEYKLEHLQTELLKLVRIADIADVLYQRLAELNAIVPRNDEDVYSILEKYSTWKASNEQAAGMRREESI
jgi:hypothetical protein